MGWNPVEAGFAAEATEVSGARACVAIADPTEVRTPSTGPTLHPEQHPL